MECKYMQIYLYGIQIGMRGIAFPYECRDFNTRIPSQKKPVFDLFFLCNDMKMNRILFYLQMKHLRTDMEIS